LVVIPPCYKDETNAGTDVGKDGFLSRRNENQVRRSENQQAKMDTTLKEMKEELTASLEAKIEGEIKTNNEKFEVLRSSLMTEMDIH
jgi:hypothetical protein